MLLKWSVNVNCSCRFDLHVHGLDLPAVGNHWKHRVTVLQDLCASLGWGWATPETAVTCTLTALGRGTAWHWGKQGDAGASGWAKSAVL